MTDKDFDKRIGDALRGYEEEPPRELFQRIEETLAALSSCSKELAGAAPPTDIVYNGFGEITRTDYDGYFEITRDDGVLLRVLEYNGSKEIERGERVYFKYNILPGNGDYVSSYSTPEQTVYDIRVLVFNDIHAVPIVRKSSCSKTTRTAATASGTT